MMPKTTIRTRIAPSPTGEMHVGSMAVLLKNYAFAKKYHGQFIVRIEDTDQQRLIPGAVERILKVIKDYGLNWDEGPDISGEYGPYIQSKRLKLYQQHAKQLLDNNKAYYCFCTKERLIDLKEQQNHMRQRPRYDRHCLTLTPEKIRALLQAHTPFVIRLKVPVNKLIKFVDMVRGEIIFNSDEVDDQVLLKSDGFPTYHLAVVVDDYLMQITHIMRGEEWISSTPKHILLYQAFGWQPPIFAHLPIFLNPDGKGKMSKRKGAVSARSFLELGYLPAVMLNFFMILGWARSDEREIMTLSEYIQEFDPSNISAKSVVFDLKKLTWMNGIYIRQLTLKQLVHKSQPWWPKDFPAHQAEQILALIHERLEILSQIEEFTSFFYRDVKHDSALLLSKSDQKEVAMQLDLTIKKLSGLKHWQLVDIQTLIRTLQTTYYWKKNQYFMMLRVGGTGRKISPPLFETLAVLGKAKTLLRLKHAKQAIE